MEKAAVFIDGGYLSKVLKLEFNKPRVDLTGLSEKICGDYERLRTYYYDCMPYQSNPPTESEKKRYSGKDKYLYRLRRLPRFEVRLGKLSKRGEEFEQKRVDVLLAVDLVRMSWDKQINKAILVAGDSDFVPPIQAAKDAGVLTQIYYSKTAVHDELLDACDDYFEMTQELVNSVLLKKE